MTLDAQPDVLAAQPTEGLLERLARLVPGVVYQYRLWPDGRSAFPYSSPGMVDIYEVTPEEVREDATPVFGRLHPDDAAKVSEDIFASAATLATFYADFRVILPRQGLRWRWSQAVPERLPDGGTLWHGIILDTTDRKLAEQEADRLQAQLLQAQKLESVGRLAGGVAHDFNNLLSVIIGNLDLAMEVVAEDHPARPELLEIGVAARRSSDLVRQLLAYARQRPEAAEVIDLEQEVRSTLPLLRRLVGEDVTLDWSAEAGLWPVAIDRAQLDQILTNLCVNARDAIDGVGTISISAVNEGVAGDMTDAEGERVRSGDYVRLTVADSGCGMDADTISRIFQPFYTTKPVGAGTGLGLAVVYGTLRRFRGFVTVESDPGVGTRFDVWLPRATGEVTVPPPATGRRHEQVRRAGESILVVDDEPALVRLVEKVLADRGYRVVSAAGPLQALEIARQHTVPFDLLLTDVVMPDMSGPDLVAALRAIHGGDGRVLYMSGYTGAALSSRLPSDRANRLVEKPFRVADLLASVRAALDAD